MKKLLLFAFVFSSLMANAQQETFEFFKKSEVDPFTDLNSQTSNIPPNNVDEKGRIWGYTNTTSEIRLTNYSDTTTIRIPMSSKQKAGYSYYAYSFIIDENKTKLVLMNGSRYLNSKSYYDYYLVKHDTLGQNTYLYLKDLGLTDTTVALSYFHSLNGKAIFSTRTGKYIWEGNLSININGPLNPTFISDKKGSLFALSSGYSGILSFHSDGTFQNRLTNFIIKAFDFNSNRGVLNVFTTGGIFELSGKTEQSISIPSSTELFRSSDIVPINPKNGSIKMSVILSKKGFNVRERNNSISYLFAGKTEIGKDSLEIGAYEYKYCAQLQADSTLRIVYRTTNGSQIGIYYVFTYKNGVAKFHKKYDLAKFSFTAKSIFTGYIGKDNSYFYVDTYSNIYQIKNDTTFTVVNTTNQKCSISASNYYTDKDFLWLSNNANASSCAIARMRHDAYFVRGNVFYDTNKNGYKDNTEFGYPKIKLIAQPSGLQLTPDYDGNYAFKGEQGKSYTIDIVDSIRFLSIIKNSYYNNIGVKLKDEKPEVNASFWLPRARCFTKLPASFYLQNTGVVPVEKVVIRLVPNKMKLIQNSTLVDTATFTYQNLGVHQSASLAYDIEWPEAELTGQTATLKTITDLYVNGAVASRKIDSVQAIIRCSYDPNDKSVTPAGISDKLYTLKTSTLQYQIRFENTGNDTAYHVVIQDTLNSNLDFSTFEVLGSSHKMNAEISKNGVVGFHFNYIMLPDSTTNKKGAQGYVRFSIKPKTTVANNTLLCNKAAIYFDQNKPVITNSTCNLLVDKIPTNPLGLENDENLAGNTIYPNPTNDWIFLPKDAEETTIYNTLGSQVLKSTELKINMAGFEEGMYVAKVRTKNGKVSTHKLSVVR